MASKKKNRFDLHEERLATTDEKGRRVFLHPEEVKGFWRNRRTLFYWFLIGLYLVLPWIHFQGKQIILLDIPKREFTLFGTTFLGHDVPLVLFVILGSIFLLGFITSIFGRAWCGWACPQTVFIDSIYRKIDLIVEGNARKRFQLDRDPWHFKKILKRLLKWSLYLLVSLHISHSLLGYFVGTRELFWMSLQSPNENLTVFFTMLFLTALFFIDFGFFREQFCLIACPYGRFQSVFMDDDSYIIAYDEKRGEPRRQEGLNKEDEGDCINCYACVKVCPTGIDIRRGTQLECIACTQCIDACDDVMSKLDKPHGLIKYTSENLLKNKKVNIFKFRSFVYLAILIGILTGFVFSLKLNKELRVVVLRGDRVPYKLIEKNNEVEVRNHFKLTFDHKRELPYRIFFSSQDPDYQNQNIQLIVAGGNPLKIDKGHHSAIVFVTAPKKIFKNGKKVFNLEIYDKQLNGHLLLLETKEIDLVGPFN